MTAPLQPLSEQWIAALLVIVLLGPGKEKALGEDNERLEG
jgi:hypothetical protein